MTNMPDDPVRVAAARLAKVLYPSGQAPVSVSMRNIITGALASDPGFRAAVEALQAISSDPFIGGPRARRECAQALALLLHGEQT